MSEVSEARSPSVLVSLARYRWSSLAIVGGVVALSAASGLLGGSGATASATIALSTPGPASVLGSGIVGDASMSRFTAQRAAYVTSDQVLALVSARAGGLSISALRARVHAEPAPTASLVTVTASAGSPGAAATLANQVVQAYREATTTEVAERTGTAVAAIGSTITRLEREARGPSDPAAQTLAAAQTISQLQKQSSDLQTEAASSADGVDFVRVARPAAARVHGVGGRDVGVGLLVGVALAGVVAWVRADRAREVRSVARAGQVLEAPLLGVVGSLAAPRDAGLLLPRQSPSPDLQVVASAVLKRIEGGVVVVVGAGADTAGSELTLAMTEGLVHQGRSTLLVDADELAAFGRKALPGKESGRLTATDALALLRSEHDFVVVDAQPIDTSAVTASVVAAADGVVIVVPSGSAESDLVHVRRSTEMLQASVLGYIYVGSADD